MRGEQANTAESRPEEKHSERRPSPAAQSPSLKQEHVAALSFVRPADIYRRVEEEKERERASIDSSRPSLDSLDRGARPNSRGNSAPRSSQDSGRDASIPSLLKPTLDPVAERKSEYGIDGFMAQDPELAQAVGAQITSDSGSLAPSLPQFDRFSSLGMDNMDFMEKKQSSTDNNKSDSVQDEVKNTSSATAGRVNQPFLAEPAAHEGKEHHGTSVTDINLQHQPSLGFRSAVDHAFDGNTESSLLSPVSGHGSQRSKEGSDMSRSNTTDSTGGISPIISRNSGQPVTEQQARDVPTRIINTPAIQEESTEKTSPGSRPTSSSTLKGPATVVNTAHSRHTSDESASSSVKAGYRRSMQPPNSNNTPAHVTAISSRKEIVERPHEGQIAMTTPTDSSQDDSETSEDQKDDQKTPEATKTDFSRRESDLAAQAQSQNESAASPIANAESNAQKSFIAKARRHAPGISTDSLGSNDSPTSQSGSPSTKGRVRDLASKYNDIHSASRSGADSPSGSISSWSSRSGPSPIISKEESAATEPSSSNHAVQENSETRPTAKAVNSDIAPPPRPKMPGGWVSHAPSEASAAPSAQSTDNYDSNIEPEQNERSRPRLEAPQLVREPSGSIDLEPTTTKRPLAGKTYQSITDNPMAALSAAGAALAESVKEATGFPEQPEPSGVDTPEGRVRSSTDTTQRPQYTTLQASSMSASTKLPTPPDKHSPQHDFAGPSSGYFPPTAPLNVRKDSPESSVKQNIHEPESATSATSTHLSLDPSGSDTEADKLRKDIARSLSPPELSSAAGGLAPVSERHSAVSSIFPSEYDAYWANQEGRNLSTATTRQSQGSLEKSSSPESHRLEQSKEPGSSGNRTSIKSPAKPSLLDKRFSWEKPKPTSNDYIGPSISSGIAQHQVEPQPSTISSNHSIAVEPAELESPPPEGKDALRPEASQGPVELPASEPKPRASISKDLPSIPSSGTRQPGVSKNGSQLDPRSFKDIMAIKNAGERVHAYQKSRERLGAQYTGLNDWLAFMVNKHPEHVNAVAAPTRPIVNTSGFSGSVRNKMPPSLAKLAKTGTGDYPSSAGNTPDSASSASPQIRESPSVSRRQEFLHQGKVFGGKASQGAKGLFAKGKSRLRGSDKVE